MRRRNCVLLLTLLAVAACTRPGGDIPDLTLVHLNDVYRIDAVEDGSRGGMSRVATIVRRLQADGRQVRITHGGDFLYPSLESQLWAGEQMIEAMNFLHDLAPMLVVPGNHEFDPRTPDSLIAAVRQSRFTWLAYNVDFATGDSAADAAFKRNFTFMAGDRMIGVFSLTLAEDEGSYGRDYARIGTGYFDLAEEQIKALESQGVDMIIGVTHLLLEHDQKIASLKARYPKFLFIVGGHEHEPEFEEGDEHTAVIMKGASNARTIWQVDIYFDDENAMPRIDTTVLSVDDTVPLDEDYQLIADRWRQKLLATAPYLESKLGAAALPLDGREVLIRNDESNLGNFIVDQMRIAFGSPPADLAFLNSGTLRLDDIVAGDITFEDIGRIFGFSSYLRYMTIGGGDFRALMEAGFRGVGPSKGYFPQVSGFRICVDRSRPNGSRIVQLLVPEGDGWAEISNDKDYLLVAPDYIYRGGDGYDFSRARDVSRPGSELQYLVLDAILNAQAKGETVGAAVNPEERRIAFLQQGEAACFK